ncbi:unnamed protein product, partial [Rotaria magnacalcarata]
SESSCNGNDGIHLFVNPNNGFPLTTDRSQSSHLPDSILRLRIVISLGNFTNLLWTRDENYIVYSSNEIVIQIAIAFNGNSSLLATTQSEPNDKK